MIGDVLLGLVILVAVLAFNTLRFPSRQIDVEPVAVSELPEQPILDRFAESLTIKTISYPTPARIDSEAFDRFKQFLEASFPLVHENLLRMTGIDFGDERNQSLLFKWQGVGDGGQGAADSAANPILLMGHYDVVPIETASIDDWTEGPFSGKVDDQYVWGRGAIDNKAAAVGMLEAVERLIAAGFQPSRTIYLSLGHDEEVGGTRGNRPIAQWMQRENIRLDYVLDEGGGIFNDFSGLDGPAAFIGIAEKGFVTLELTAKVEEAGHSSMPPPLPQTAIGILGEALERLHRSPHQADLGGGMGMTLEYLGSEMSWMQRVAIANRWLFDPLLIRQLDNTPLGNAALRTTIAPTIVQGGVKDNVLPTQATMTLNLRILPGDSVESAVNHVKEVISDLSIDVDATEMQRPPSKRLSSTDCDAFEQLHRSIRQIYPNVVVAPFVVVAGTDASHYEELASETYRFVPWRLGKEDLKRIHGIDERLARDDYLDLVRFYEQLIRNSCEI
jgi:carboxypeptidase PM20D1